MIVRLATDAMRTRFEFALCGENEAALRAAGEAALAEIEATEQRLSAFMPGSLVSLVNREAHSRPISLDADTFDLLSLAERVWRLTRGAFDITIGPLMRAWGFRGQPFDAGALARAEWGFTHVQLDPVARTIAFTRPGVSIDLGAIGKGHALDLAGRVLREAGVTRGLLHAGTSSVLALGTPMGEPGWRVAVATGRPEEVPPVVTLADGAALGVSAPRGRTSTHEGRVIGHILDPRTGTPAIAANTAATVVTCVPDAAAAADAWSTALLVLGEHPLDAPDELTSMLDDGPGRSPRWRTPANTLNATTPPFATAGAH